MSAGEHPAPGELALFLPTCACCNIDMASGRIVRCEAFVDVPSECVDLQRMIKAGSVVWWQARIIAEFLVRHAPLMWVTHPHGGPLFDDEPLRRIEKLALPHAMLWRLEQEQETIDDAETAPVEAGAGA